MGWLENQREAQQDYLVLGAELADATLGRLAELKAGGHPIDLATEQVVREVAQEVRGLQEEGIGMWGFAGVMAAYSQALQARGLSKKSANQLKKHVRQCITLERYPGSQ